MAYDADNRVNVRTGATAKTGYDSWGRATGVTDPALNDGTASYTPGVSERRSESTKFG